MIMLVILRKDTRPDWPGSLGLELDFKLFIERNWSNFYNENEYSVKI